MTKSRRRMRFPELIECRNTTYEAMLCSRESEHRRILANSFATFDMNLRGLFEIQKEMKRWGVKCGG